MLRSIYILSIALLLACTARAIDFTPKYMTEYVEGVVIRRAYFADGNDKYAIKVPVDVDLAAGNGGAYFKFNKYMYATMTWRVSPLTPGVPFDADHLPKYADAAQSLLPKGSTHAKIEKEEDNVYPINHWICHRYTVSYAFYGFAMRDTITFLNLSSTEQIVFQVSSRDTDADAVGKASWDVIRSWHPIEADTEKPFN